VHFFALLRTLRRSDEKAAYLASRFFTHFKCREQMHVEYKINWQDERKYRPIVEQMMRAFAKEIEGILGNVNPGRIANSHNISLKRFIHDLYCYPHVKNYHQYYNEQSAKRESLLHEIEEIESGDHAIALENIKSVNDRITAKERELDSLTRMKGLIIAASIGLTILPVVFIGGPSFLIGPAVYIVWLLIKFGKNSTITNLRHGDLVVLSAHRDEIVARLEELRNKVSQIDRGLASQENEVIETVYNAKNHIFQDAEQNELRWRTPSFVDEELEQLISLVKNLFYEITNKITKKKTTAKGLQLQTTMGLGGMGFDD
jgi:hypothetical protein